MTSEEIAKLTNKELFSLCVEWGSNARKWIKKFASLLPEVNRRDLFKERGFYSIYEFAARVGGMSNKAVDNVLRVSDKLQDKPLLHNLLSDQGWSKLRVVATIATPKNQQFWAEKVETMCKSSLETFVREVKQNNLFEDESNRGLEEAHTKLFPGENLSTISFKISVNTETGLRIFKHKFEKESGRPQDWDAVLKELLSLACRPCNRIAGRGAEKLAPDKSVDNTNKPPDCAEKQALSKPMDSANRPPRHIPARVKRLIDRKYRGRCAYPGCKNAATSYHHTRRFSLTPSHDPDFIAPLCKAHERLAHHSLIKNEEAAPENWQIQLFPDKSSPKYAVDMIVQSHRKGPGVC